eukprot:7269765-Heterocapsa_arctica.AAC.1
MAMRLVFALPLPLLLALLVFALPLGFRGLPHRSHAWSHQLTVQASPQPCRHLLVDRVGSGEANVLHGALLGSTFVAQVTAI